MKTPPELWNYACLLYEQESVQMACLQLQDDHGVNVSLLLYCCWRLECDGFVAESVLEQAASIALAFDQPLITPLRKIRRAMKLESPRMVNDDWLGIRAELTSIELKAERLLLSALEKLPNSPSETHYDSLETIAQWLYPRAFLSTDNEIQRYLNMLTEQIGQ